MRDGQTRELKRPTASGDWAEYCDRFSAKIVVLSGRDAGNEFPIDQDRLVLGRGPGVHVVLNDQAASRQHAAIEFAAGGFRIVDLESTNGLTVEGRPTQTAPLEHGQRFKIGGRVLQLVIEERESAPETYELSSEI